MMKLVLDMLTTIKVIYNWKISLLLEERIGLYTRLNSFRSWRNSKQRSMRKLRIPQQMKSTHLLPLLTTRTQSYMRQQFTRKNLLSKRNYSQHFKVNFKLINRMNRLVLRNSERNLLKNMMLNRNLHKNLLIMQQKELQSKKKSVFLMKLSMDIKMVYGITMTLSKRELTIILMIKILIMVLTMREKFLRLKH